jgi:hypothetical protein
MNNQLSMAVWCAVHGRDCQLVSIGPIGFFPLAQLKSSPKGKETKLTKKGNCLILLRHELLWQAIFAGRIALQHGH